MPPFARVWRVYDTLVMAHLWRRDDSGDEAANGWGASSLEADVVPLPGDGACVLRRHRGPAGECWVLLASPAVRLNGVAVDTGVRVLRDRDELVAGGERLWFSSEVSAEVTSMPAAERAVSCPRCLLVIAPETPAVRCPCCAIWHHQTDQYPCWRYQERCARCSQPTALDAGFQWSPECL